MRSRKLLAALSTAALATPVIAGELFHTSAMPREGERVVIRVDAAALAQDTFILAIGEAEEEAVGTVTFQPRGDLVWRGRVGEAEATSTLTLHRGFTAGVVYTSEGGAYSISPVGDEHVVAELEKEVEEVVIPVMGGAELAPTREVHSGPPATLTVPTTQGGGAVIDVLEVYTPRARDERGGVAQIEAVIRSGVDLANTAFENSHLDVRLRLVATARWDYEEVPEPATNLGNLQTDPVIAALRDQHDADLVGVWGSDGILGAAYRLLDFGSEAAEYGFHSVHHAGAFGRTYPHEVGHNLGCDHDPDNAIPPGEDPNPFARGHYGTSSQGGFGTIMSYRCPQPCTLIHNFSNPAVSYDGVPTGTAARDNARMVEIAAPLVASFRGGSAGPCIESPTTLCLRNGRFKVEATWETASGSGAARLGAHITDNGGWFWFFNQANPELFVKVHDACVPPFNRFWVFAAGLTNVEVTLTVTDTLSGEVNPYVNPLGQAFLPIQDTQAFATCP